MRADCHIHMVLDGVNWKQAIARHEQAVDTVFIRGILARYRDLGYTWLRDGGDRWGVSRRAAELAAEYGIVYRTPLAPISKAGCYGGFIGEQFVSLRDYACLVGQRRQQGAHFIKIMISGLMDFDRFGVLTQPGLENEEIREMVHIAHEEGFSVMAHANGARVIQTAAEAGVDSVEHGAYADDDALWAMKEAGTVWVPTLSTIGNLMDGPRGVEGAAPYKGDRKIGAAGEILHSALENLAAFVAVGGLVAPGTDAGAWAVPHGCQTEEALLALAGVGSACLAAGTERIMERF